MNKLFITISLLFTTLSMAVTLREGAYVGDGANKENLTLYLRSIKGREGSFFGLLVREKKNIFSSDKVNRIGLYRVDPNGSSSYIFNPLTVTEDGLIGIMNDDPSLVLNIAEKDGKEIFKIYDANSSNNTGFQGFMDFDGKRSQNKWLGVVEGTFTQKNNPNALFISGFDNNEGVAQATFATNEVNGGFQLSREYPGMYVIRANSVLATGTVVNKFPKSIIVFLQKCSSEKSCDDAKVVVVDPEHDQRILIFDKE